MDTPATATTPAITVCQKVTVSLGTLITATDHNIACAPKAEDPEGCVCTFELSDTQESYGTLKPLDGGPMVHLFSDNFPQSVSYCLNGDSLQLQSADGEYLFDRLGLRTMDLVKSPTPIDCTDHMQGPGEDGVDCGAACPVLCSQINCSDNAQGPGEEGVDCGPNCPKKTCM